jgi:hypothetical protein
MGNQSNQSFGFDQHGLQKLTTVYTVCGYPQRSHKYLRRESTAKQDERYHDDCY